MLYPHKYKWGAGGRDAKRRVQILVKLIDCVSLKEASVTARNLPEPSDLPVILLTFVLVCPPE